MVVVLELAFGSVYDPWWEGLDHEPNLIINWASSNFCSTRVSRPLAGHLPAGRTPGWILRTVWEDLLKNAFLGWKLKIVDLEPLGAVLGLNSVRIGISVKNYPYRWCCSPKTRLQCRFWAILVSKESGGFRFWRLVSRNVHLWDKGQMARCHMAAL